MAATIPSFSAALLAGGKSSRMGRDKAMLSLPGTDLPLWRRQLSVLEALGPETILWSGHARPGMPGNIRIVEDAESNAGPLGGIVACLQTSTGDLVVVLAIDLPQMTPDFLRRLLAESSTGCGAAATHEGIIEPLAAVYPRRLQALAEQHLREGRRAVKDLVAAAAQIGAMRLVPLAPEEIFLFRNVNRPEDFAPTRA